MNLPIDLVMMIRQEATNLSENNHQRSIHKLQMKDTMDEIKTFIDYDLFGFYDDYLQDEYEIENVDDFTQQDREVAYNDMSKDWAMTNGGLSEFNSILYFLEC